MKKQLLTGVLALSTIVGAQAQVTDYFVTGATAFRGGFTNAMNNTSVGFFTGGPITRALDVASPGASVTKFGVWTGNVAGVGGLVRVYASFSGSVEGIRDLTTGNTTTPFFPASIATASGNFSVPASNATLTAPADFAFSDAFQASTQFKTPALTNTNVGVIPFVMVTNDNAPADFTNVQANQFSSLFKAGYQKLSIFTGNFSNSSFVFATGRYNLSGTRIIYLAETATGVTTLLQQYKPSGNTTVTTALRLWPTGDGLNASTPDVEGNGGWEGSGSVRNSLITSTSAVQIQFADGEVNDEFADPSTVQLLSCVGSGDVAAIITGGGKALRYNGVSYAASGTPTAAENEALFNGAYSLWGYQHLYDTGASGNKLIVRNKLRDTLNQAAILGTNGVIIGLMKVSRSTDGGSVGPL